LGEIEGFFLGPLFLCLFSVLGFVSRETGLNSSTYWGENSPFIAVFSPGFAHFSTQKVPQSAWFDMRYNVTFWGPD
jgi:hypothetical protein